jgi:hypothetical protein
MGQDGQWQEQRYVCMYGEGPGDPAQPVHCLSPLIGHSQCVDAFGVGRGQELEKRSQGKSGKSRNESSKDPETETWWWEDSLGEGHRGGWQGHMTGLG